MVRALRHDQRTAGMEFNRIGIRDLRVPGLCTLNTFRSQTNMPGDTLPGIVKSPSGSGGGVGPG